MKKVLYALILMLCLAGGLGVGILRQRAKAGGDALVLMAPVETPSELADGEPPPDGEMTPTDEMASGEATPEETPSDTSSTEVAMAEPTPDTSAVTSEEVAASGRSFGGGELKDPVRPSRKSRASSGGGGGSSSSSVAMSSEPVSSGGESVPFNTEVGSVGTVIDEAPAPKKGKKAKPEPTPEPVTDTVPFDSVDDLPTVDTADAGPAESGWDDTGTTTAATTSPDSFGSTGGGTEVAMLTPSGPTEMVFPSASGGRASLKKVTQQKRGATSVVKIQINGSAPCKVTHLRASGSKPARVFVDFEDTELPGGSASPISGTGAIKDISAKYFAGSAGIGTARIEISLTSGEKFPSVTPKGNFKASGTVEVVIGGGDSF